MSLSPPHLSQHIKTFWMACGVFLCGLVLTYFYKLNFENKIEDKLQEQLNSQTKVVADQIQARINLYISTLRSGAEILDRGHIENFNDRFLLFCQSQRFQNANTGINEIGFVPAIAKDPPEPLNKVTHLCSVPVGILIDANKEFQVNPAFYAQFRKPIKESQILASDFFDMNSLAGASRAEGLLFYYPIGNFDDNPMVKLVANSRLVGWLFVTLRKSFFIEKIKTELPPQLQAQLEVVTENPSPKSIIFQSDYFVGKDKALKQAGEPFSQTQVLVAGKFWRLSTTYNKVYLSSYRDQNQFSITLAGAALSGFLAVLFLFLRSRYLQKQAEKRRHDALYPEGGDKGHEPPVEDAVPVGEVVSPAPSFSPEGIQAQWQSLSFDPVTQLPTSPLFLDRMQLEARRAERDNYHFGLLCISIDKFAVIVDAYGEVVSKELLDNLAKKISSCVRTTDTVALMDNNIFMVLLAQQNEVKNLTRIAYKVLETLSGPAVLSKQKLTATVSIGLTVFPEDGKQVSELMQFSNEARLEAEALGGNQMIFYSRPLGEVSGKRRILVREIREAITTKQLILRFQPVVNIKTGKFGKAEALVRWISPEDGEIKPYDFISIAEDAGLIVEIGNFVFSETVSLLQKWKKILPPDFQISINLSPQQLRLSRNVAKTWIQILKDKEISPRSVVLEITEGMLLEDDRQVINALFELSNAGLEFCLDDFGTGYSSISYLKRLKIHYLKIDQSFIRDIANNVEDQKIVEGILLLAKNLDIQSIAEGIETKAQLDHLTQFQCEFGQGYYFARPMMSDDFIEWLQDRLNR